MIAGRGGQSQPVLAQMAASSVAAAGAAVAVYFYNRRSPLFTCGTAPSADDDVSDQEPSEERAFLRHTGPNNWLEALYFFAEALRYARFRKLECRPRRIYTQYHMTLSRTGCACVLRALAHGICTPQCVV